MKKILYILSIMATLSIAVACSNDEDFTESIYDTSIPAIDTTAATALFDQWLYDNFVVPYNVDVQYRFNLSASDLTFSLTPADYDRSQLLAYLIKYLYYDVYTKYAGDDFMKQYGPRIFHFIGSSGYSPTTGTEVLGTAAGGVKITLYNINAMTPYEPGTDYTSTDIDTLNEKYFHTMHHEFSHILHQTKSYPVTFGQVTSSSYDPNNWQDRDSVTSHSMGYVTQYASGEQHEDFVETLSCIITDTDYRWMMRIINAAAQGWRQGDREDILALVDSLNIDVDAPGTHWNNFTLYAEEEYDTYTGTYEESGRWVLDVHRNVTSRVVNKENTAYVSQFRYPADKAVHFNSFRNEFLGWVQVSNDDNLAGINALLKKISIATEWYTDQWGLHAFELRDEVKQRQNDINNFLHNEVVIFPLK